MDRAKRGNKIVIEFDVLGPPLSAALIGVNRHIVTGLLPAWSCSCNENSDWDTAESALLVGRSESAS